MGPPRLVSLLSESSPSNSLVRFCSRLAFFGFDISDFFSPCLRDHPAFWIRKVLLQFGALEKSVEKYCKCSNLGVWLVRDTDIPVCSLIHRKGHLFRPQDHQQILAECPGSHVLHPLLNGFAVHREMNDRAIPGTDLTYRFCRCLDLEWPSKPVGDISGRFHRICRIFGEDDTVCTQGSSGETDMRGHPVVSARSVTESKHCHRSIRVHSLTFGLPGEYVVIGHANHNTHGHRFCVADMELSGARVLVTGGAGFVGSHLAERLLSDGAAVVAVDDLSNGRREWVPDEATFIEGDLTQEDVVESAIDESIDVVFHLAARKDVNDPNPRSQFEANTGMTASILERMAAVGVDHIAFTSSSTVYGEAPRPTPEDFPQSPISMYGAAKTAEEALISSYVHGAGMTAWIFRFANIVGPRLQTGAVIVDFIDKLLSDPETLEIKGDGRQEKSYMSIDSCVDAMLHVVGEAAADRAVYNLGTRTTTSVITIADIVSETMNLEPDYEFTGGDRGWTGDVPKMRLSIEKLRSLGWEPEESSDEAVRQATEALLEQRVDA